MRWLKHGKGYAGWAPWYILSHPWEIPKYWWQAIRYAYQRVAKGYDSPCTFDTSSHLSEHIPALLKELKAWGNSVPCFDRNCFPESHGLSGSEHDEDLVKWRAILDEIIAGFEAAHDLMDGLSPADNEFYDEWDRRYPGKESSYWKEDSDMDPEIHGQEWCTVPEYDALHEELKVTERREEWRKERLKVFHRGMILFHMYFMDLWD
jgi:hypothetical protein